MRSRPIADCPCWRRGLVAPVVLISLLVWPVAGGGQQPEMSTSRAESAAAPAEGERNVAGDASEAASESAAGTAAGTSAELTAPRWVVHESDRGPLLLGEVTRRDILTQFPDWAAEYAVYEPAAEPVRRLAEVYWSVEIVCVLGTWCSDSEREVPRFWKLLDHLGQQHLSLSILAVGRSSDETALPALVELGFAEGIRNPHEIEYVPTFIFRQHGEEIGRIIETPRRSLEEDMAAILFGDELPAEEVKWH